ncbi:class I SAM-dependent RNA methyltransferase [Rothia sp. CCM 9416]|uniref:class I SAM-dependent RNA methyltransferase n=1 Tax=Rothia sp. CCM 9416 TaxID=3402655 RepID=UPI003AE6F7E5
MNTQNPTTDTASFDIGSLVQVTPERPAHGGAMVARVGERVVFVRHAVVGETALARITGRGPKGRYFFADVIAVDQPSPHRRPHPWEPADALAQENPLGGMEYGHLLPATQRDYKRQVLAEQLVRLGGLSAEHPLITQLQVQELPLEGEGPADLGWRTRVHYTVEGESGKIAMFRHSSSEPVPLESFPLADMRLQELELHKLTLEGLARLDAAVSASNMVTLVFWVSAQTRPTDVAPAIEDQCRKLWGSLEDRQITLIFRPEKQGGRKRGTKPQEVVLGAGNTELLETATVYAQDFYWLVDATGFWQIHRSAPEVLGNAVLEATKLKKGMTVYDLYAGAGLFTALAADAVGDKGTVLSVEGSATTHRNARTNFAAQGPSRTHRSERTSVRLERGDVSAVLGKLGPQALAGRFPTPDLVICDPSREGAGKKVMEQVNELNPATIVYVACDPAALGRDTGYLGQAGWQLASVQGFDMYPNTHHVEALAVFTRK